MKRTSVSFQGVFVSLFAFLVLVLAPGSAKADEVAIAGTTAGCFGPGCVPAGTGMVQSSTLLGLTFNGSFFDGLTPGGFLAIGSGRPYLSPQPYFCLVQDS